MKHEYLRTVEHYGYVLGEWRSQVRGADPLVSVANWDVVSFDRGIEATVFNEQVARSVAQQLRGVARR